MAELALRSRTGEQSGTVAVADDVFAIQPNVAVLHQVVTAQLAARRAGTQSTKTRAEVRGGGKKPYKQKGTGNARQGSTRSPQFEGGGVALGPKPRSYRQRTPKKMVRLALRSALSDRAAQDRVLVVDDWGFETPSTKGAVAALRALALDGSVLIVVARGDEATIKSFRNVPEVQLILAGELNAYDVLANRWIVFTRSTLPTGAEATTEPSAASEPNAPAEATEPSESASVSDSSQPSAYAEDAIATQQELGASSQSEDALLDDDSSTYAHEAAVVADETGEQA